MLVGRSEKKLTETRERFGGGDAVVTAVAEAADGVAIKAAIDAAVDKFGGLDVLFANAGTEGRLQSLEDFSEQDFRSVMDTNVLGVWLCMKYGAEALRKSGNGSLIATSSIAGAVAAPNLGVYVASKHAVCGLVKAAALEMGPAVRVNAIAPGPVDNRMMGSVGEQLAPEAAAAVRAQFEEATALKRYATNEEIANLALFLASEESSYCTGGYFVADGGFIVA